MRKILYLFVLLFAFPLFAADWTRCESGEVKIEVAVVNVNTATAEELSYLYRVGPVTAEKIIAGRPFESATDVLKIKGLGPSWWRSNGLHVVTTGETTLSTKVGAADESEPLDWTCADGRKVALVCGSDMDCESMFGADTTKSTGARRTVN
jgi:hypothetical protein